jgi:hypothetical protein
MRVQRQFGLVGKLNSIEFSESRESRLSNLDDALDQLEKDLVELEKKADRKILNEVRPEIRNFVLKSIGDRPKYLKPSTANLLFKLKKLNKELDGGEENKGRFFWKRQGES